MDTIRTSDSDSYNGYRNFNNCDGRAQHGFKTKGSGHGKQSEKTAPSIPVNCGSARTFYFIPNLDESSSVYFEGNPGKTGVKHRGLLQGIQ